MAWTIRALPEAWCDCCGAAELIAPAPELDEINGRPVVATVTGEYGDLLGHEVVRVLRAFSEGKHGNDD